MRSPVTEAFVLAAGLGTRMRPITDTMPKPLVTVAGKSLLDHSLDALARADVKMAVVNVHYLADMIETHVAKRDRPQIMISNERSELLDSGGGVKHGIGHFGGDDLFILNADSFWVDGRSSNLSAMQAAWDPDKMDILLLLASLDDSVGFDGKGDFFRDEGGRLTRRGDAASAPYAYAGAMIAKTQPFRDENKTKFSLNALFDAAIAGERLFGVTLDGLWLHVGTPKAIKEAELAIEKAGF